MPLFRRPPPRRAPLHLVDAERAAVPGVRPSEAKASVTPALVTMTMLGQPVWTGYGYAELARQGFASNPIVYRCIRMIAEAAASAPLVVFEDGARTAADHPLQRLLDHPNPEQSGADLLEFFFGALQTGGDSYLQAVGEGAPGELYTLRPDRLQIVPGPRGWPLAYDYRTDLSALRIDRRADGWMPVLHLKLFNPTDDYYGLSPLRAARFAVDIHNASSAWNKALLDNAARPCGALTYANSSSDRMTEEQFNRLKQELAEAHTGAAAAGMPMLLEGGLDWKPMSLSPAEMDFIEGKHVAAREIALAFGVPPQLLGIPGDATYNTYREAQLAFWRNTVAPLAERAARALTGWLGPRFGGAVVAVDLDRVPALAAEREALWARLDAASFLTSDERRRMAGLGVIEPDALGEVADG